MTVVSFNTITMSMRLPCHFDSCDRFAKPLYEQLSTDHYSTGASVMAVPDSLEDWRADHRTARKRADKAERHGYRFSEVLYPMFADDIFAINTSLQQRQGRPMTAGYTTHRAQGYLGAHQTRCQQHRTHTYGVTSDGTLVAYMTLHRAGDLAMVSMILGHGDHLDHGIMFLLIQGAVEDQAGLGGFFYYNLHNSGQEGLRWAKERYGFHQADIHWTTA